MRMIMQFSRRLTDEDIAAIDRLAQQYQLPGFTVSPNFQSIDYTTIRAYNPDYNNEIDRIEELENAINNYFRTTGSPITGEGHEPSVL